MGTPLHGANLFPAGELGERLRAAVDAYMAAATAVGQAVLRGISLSLGLPEGYIAEHYTADPLVLFRIFHYPPLVPTASAGDAASLPLWSVGEHTDYGLLTVLKQDDCGGLQVPGREWAHRPKHVSTSHTPSPAQVKTLGGTWVDAPPIPGTLVINLGDMLDKMTAGERHACSDHPPPRLVTLAPPSCRPVPQHAPPSAQRVGQRPLLVPALSRPGVGVRSATPAPGLRGLRCCCCCRRRCRGAAAVGRRRLARVPRHLWRVRARQGVQGVPAAEGAGR